MFEHVDAYLSDFAISHDPRFVKSNLAIGSYFDDLGNNPAMQAVREAKALISKRRPERAAPEGTRQFRSAVQRLVFGDELRETAEDRIITVQAPGGSLAIKAGADLLQKYFHRTRVWISSPSCDRHRGIFEAAGFRVESYLYFRSQTSGVDFGSFAASLLKIPRGEVVFLQACCHDPTGADLADQQWVDVARTMKERGLIPFFDLAYQGFGTGLDSDAFPIRHFASSQINFLVASSMSHNFALYDEGCGSLSIVCARAGLADAVLGPAMTAMRRNCFFQTANAGQVVSTILVSEKLRNMWTTELESVRLSISRKRTLLHSHLREMRPQINSDYILDQFGLFSYPQIINAQAPRLRDAVAGYHGHSARICLAALAESAIPQVADALAEVLA